MTNKNTFEEANRLLDNNEVEKAREIYRQAALLSEPSKFDLDNMNSAEIASKMVFMNRLNKMYPNSMDVQVTVASHWVNYGKKKQAIEKYSEILDTLDPTTKIYIRVLLGRFVAQCQVFNPDIEMLKKDFDTLWHSNIVESPSRLRWLLILKLMTDTTRLEVLQSLKSCEFLSENVRDLLEARITLLSKMETIETHLKSESS